MPISQCSNALYDVRYSIGTTRFGGRNSEAARERTYGEPARDEVTGNRVVTCKFNEEFALPANETENFTLACFRKRVRGELKKYIDIRVLARSMDIYSDVWVHEARQ